LQQEASFARGAIEAQREDEITTDSYNKDHERNYRQALKNAGIVNCTQHKEHDKGEELYPG
jgi:hypothetical protein